MCVQLRHFLPKMPLANVHNVRNSIISLSTKRFAKKLLHDSLLRERLNLKKIGLGDVFKSLMLLSFKFICIDQLSMKKDKIYFPQVS